MGNTPSSDEIENKAKNQNTNMQNSNNPPGWAPPSSVASNNPNIYNPSSQPSAPGWSVPSTQQIVSAQSKAKEANAPPAHTGLYPPPPAYDAILQNKQPDVIGPQNPTAPPNFTPAHSNPPNFHTPSFGQQAYHPPPQATGYAPKPFVPPQTFTPSQFHAQPTTFSNPKPQPSKFYSQPTIVSGNSAQTVSPSMPIDSAAMGLNTNNWAAASQNGLPPNAFRAGHDLDGSPLFVCRAVHGGDILPGKAVPSHRCAYVAYCGGEHAKRQFEVLVGDCYRWQRASGGSVPHNAVEGGRTAQGEKLYVGRASFNNTVTPGKVHPSHHCLYVAFGGAERHFSEYEVLVYA